VLKRSRGLIAKIMTFYVSGASVYGLWVFVLLLFRASCPFTSCPEIIIRSSVLDVVTAILPDKPFYAIVLAIGRGLLWLPNLLVSLFGTSQTQFYALLDQLLP
jgi:hypothetical protein